ncbi:MAG: TIGR02452 family protein [Aureispira sp.]
MSTSRSNRRVIAQDTLDCLQKGHYTNTQGQIITIAKAQQYAQQHTQLYTPSESATLLEAYPLSTSSAKTQYQVTSESTLDAVRRLLEEGREQVLALNFASAKNPGGGFLGGSQAQEESLARSTGLYPCLLEAKEYYTIHRKTNSCFYTDHMIYSPLVPLLKDDEGVYLPSLQQASFITSPAVNTGVVKRQEKERLAEVPAAMKKRLAKVLAIAHAQGHQQLVLGAWGCGVFQNDPKEIAQYYQEVLEDDFKGVFEKIVFAIYAKDERFIRPFQERFGR